MKSRKTNSSFAKYNRALELLEIDEVVLAKNRKAIKSLVERYAEAHHISKERAVAQLLVDGTLNQIIIESIINLEYVIEILQSEYACHRQTGKRHAIKAGLHMLYPPYAPTQKGGARPGAGPKRKYIIQVAENGRCYVCRYQQQDKTYQPATNWEDLEIRAKAASVTLHNTDVSAQYECPRVLVESAVWDDLPN